MAEESSSIFEEINEELKHDQFLMFLKKHKNTILSVVTLVVIGIFAHSSWYSRKNKQIEEVTTALLSVLQSPSSKNGIMIEAIAKNAPSELRPILSIIKSGRKLLTGEEINKNAEVLLELSRKRGVDIIWKDLALIIYSSYRLKLSSELIEILEPLTSDKRPFRFTALELIGSIYESNGNHDRALEYFKKITDNKEAPNTLKSRIAMLSSYIKNNLEK